MKTRRTQDDYKPKAKTKIRNGFTRYTLYLREEYKDLLQDYADKNAIWVTDAIDLALRDWCEKQFKRK